MWSPCCLRHGDVHTAKPCANWLGPCRFWITSCVLKVESYKSFLKVYGFFYDWSCNLQSTDYISYFLHGSDICVAYSPEKTAQAWV